MIGEKMKLHGAHAFGPWVPAPNDRRGDPWRNRWWWAEKEAFRKRIPYLGCYNLQDPKIIDAIAKECDRGRIDFLSLCTFWNGQTGALEGDDLLRGLKNCKVPGKPKHYLAFEPRGSFRPLEKLDDLIKMIEAFAVEFEHPDYQMLPGTDRPIVSILGIEHLAEKIAGPILKMEVGDILRLFRRLADRNIYFIANGEAAGYWCGHAVSQGYDCISAYNWLRKWGGKDRNVPGPLAANVDELYALYAEAWAYLNSLKGIDVLLPTITGFDSSPTGEAVVGDSTDAQFESHLGASDVAANSNPRCIGTVVDALDEHWEDSVMLPDPRHGRARMGIHRRAYQVAA